MAVMTASRPGHRETRFATVAQVAAYLNLSRPSIYRLMHNGDLPDVKMGGARRIAWGDVDTYANSCVIAADI